MGGSQVNASSASAQAFRATLRKAKRPLALAGAGLSAASGIPTFRGAGGLWRQHDALSLATPQAFNADPSKVWQFYHYRRTVCLNSEPNTAHVALARLLEGSGPGTLRKSMMPSAQSFHLVTQNVDGLSLRAISSISSDSSSRDSIIEMHGNLFKTICTRCSHSEMNYDNPISEGLRGTETLSVDYKSTPLELLPRCKQQSKGEACNGLLRPGVVWFGEAIPHLTRLESLIAECDLILVIGTSSTVYPAAGFAQQVKHNGGQVAVFNIDSPQHDSHDETDWYFEGPVEMTLPTLLKVD